MQPGGSSQGRHREGVHGHQPDLSRAPLVVLVELIDAAECTDDFVTGVVGLAGGRLGGVVDDGRPWLARRLSAASSRLFRGGSLASGLAGSYGPEQLRKAAVEARRMASILDELRATGECAGLLARLDELELAAMPDQLGTVAVRSPEAR